MDNERIDNEGEAVLGIGIGDLGGVRDDVVMTEREPSDDGIVSLAVHYRFY